MIKLEFALCKLYNLWTFATYIVDTITMDPDASRLVFIARCLYLCHYLTEAIWLRSD